MRTTRSGRVQAHLTHSFSPRVWLAGDANIYRGGRTAIDGVKHQDRGDTRGLCVCLRGPRRRGHQPAPMIREGIDPRELTVNARRERERIEPVPLAHERHHLRGVGLRAGLDAPTEATSEQGLQAAGPRIARAATQAARTTAAS